MDTPTEVVGSNPEIVDTTGVKMSKSAEKKEKKRLAALAKKNEKKANKPETTKKINESELDPSVCSWPTYLVIRFVFILFFNYYRNISNLENLHLMSWPNPALRYTHTNSIQL